jgi:acetyl-CoA C-acetyltransferase
MIVGAVRTPSGALLGALSSLKTPELGAHVIQHAVQRSGIPAAQVEEVFFGRWHLRCRTSLT